ncbi:MAG TPA: WYL domain-containing protein, partial [Angustibacter sp.]|nr:WYL domain-containing protein [Angustibacter sp.]
VAPADPLLEAVARALRSTARHAPAGRDDQPRLTPGEPADTLARLREAVATTARIWIGYADGNGRVERRVIQPLSVDGGRVTAYDHASEQVRTFSVHRVTGVAPADAGSP